MTKERCGSPEKHMNNIDRQREKQGHFKGNTNSKESTSYKQEKGKIFDTL